MEGKQKSKGWCWWLLVLVYAALVVAMAILTLWRNFGGSDSKAAHVPGPPGTIVDKYAGGLSIAMQFFDVQKSGKLVNNRIAWRGDSGLEDGSEENLDLSKGMYDAGDLMKFGFPMAFTATVLSWAILEYGDQMKAVKELEHARDSLQWITDYLINAHPSTNLLYIQVGDPELDHNCWERPEVMTERRPLTQVNATYPGSDIAAETAAAMASSSLVFKTVNSTYSKLLLKHAQQLFAFADTYRGSYSISIPRVQKYYNSTGYGDELLWAASWLYHATGDQLYLRYVTTQNGQAFANWGSPSWFSWDNKLAGTQVLLSRVNFFGAKEISTADNLALQMYRKTAEAVMCTLLPDSPTATPQRTEGGLIWVSQWNVLQYTVASSFLALLYSDYMLRSQTSTLYCNGKLYNPMDLRNFAILQFSGHAGPLEFVPFTSTADSTSNLGSIMALSSLFYMLGSNFKEDSLADYVLGNNPFKMSYLVGYGNNYPQYIHHRGASIPVDANTGCRDGFKWLNSTDPNPNLAIGALVGGPFLNETYIDSRNNSMQGEPTTYNSAFVVGLLSGLLTTSSVVQSFA